MRPAPAASPSSGPSSELAPTGARPNFRPPGYRPQAVRYEPPKHVQVSVRSTTALVGVAISSCGKPLTLRPQLDGASDYLVGACSIKQPGRSGGYAATAGNAAGHDCPNAAATTAAAGEPGSRGALPATGVGWVQGHGAGPKRAAPYSGSVVLRPGRAPGPHGPVDTGQLRFAGAERRPAGEAGQCCCRDAARASRRRSLAEPAAARGCHRPSGRAGWPGRQQLDAISGALAERAASWRRRLARAAAASRARRQCAQCGAGAQAVCCHGRCVGGFWGPRRAAGVFDAGAAQATYANGAAPAAAALLARRGASTGIGAG